MKKFLSMFLVLTMVVTTLMGVMVMDVNAADPTAPTKTSVTVTEDENSAEGRKVLIQMGSQYIPTGSTNIGNKIGNTLGSIYVQGYDYGNTTLAAAGVASMVANGTTAPAHIADVSKITFGNLSGIKTDWKAASIYDETAKTQAAKVTGNYIRLMPTAVSLSKTNALGGTPFKNIEATEHANLTTANAYKVTFYGYTQNVDTKNGSSIKIAGAVGGSESGGANISGFSASNLVSEKGVPHKIDLVYTTDGAESPVYALNVFVDGVNVAFAQGTAGKYVGNYIGTNLYTNLGLDGATFKGTLTTGDTDWFMFYDTTAQTAFELVDRTALESELLITPAYTSKANTFRTDDYITGVIASLDAAIKAALEVTTAGDKVVDIAESKYNNPASLFDTTVENATVKLVSRTTGEEVAPASATGTMDDYYFMVNGIYIIPNKVADPLPYTVVSGKNVAPHMTISDGYNSTRTRIQSYIKSSVAEGEDAYGGLRTGFVKYTAEPRGTFTFSSGAIYYDQSAYIALSGVGRYKKADYMTEYVTKPILTAQFDLFVPEYTATNSSKVRIAVNGNTNETTSGDSNNKYRKSMGDIVFTTNGKTSGTVSGNIVDVVGNAWNTIGIQYDTSEVAEKGYKVTLYVNGEMAKTYYTGNLKGDDGVTTLADGVGTTNIAWINYMRMYWPDYTSIGIMNDKWIVGEYTPGVTDTTELAIGDTVDGVTAFDDENLIIYDSGVYATEDALISEMSSNGYEAVYEYETNFNGIDKAYDSTDGSVETKSGLTYTNQHIKRWIENSGYFTVSGEGENTVYTKKSDSDLTADQKKYIGYITSAVWESDTEATLVVTKAFSDSVVYKGVCSTFDEICEANPELRTKKLVGFAVVEAGKLPRVYTLQEMGTELYTLGYDETTNVATLNYREFGGTDNIPFILLVGAYDAKGKLLALDVSEAMTIDSANEADGVKTKTFTADFGELDLTTVRKYKVFAFNSFAERKPIMTNYSMINPAYVAPAE